MTDIQSNRDNHPLSQEGYDLMAAAFEVHNELGGGLLEEIYQECLELEPGMRGIPFQSKQELPVFYKKRRLKKRYIPDLYVHARIVAELKSVSQLTSDHEAQLLNNVRLVRHPVGYLINFGPIGKLEWKRFLLKEFVGENR